MTDVKQEHLNLKLEQYCQINGGMYNQIHVLGEDEQLPSNFDLDTIMIKKQGKSHAVYWHENGQVVEKSLRIKNNQFLQNSLLRPGISRNRKLINKIVQKYQCNSSPNLSFIDDKGNCNGWSFLYPYYVSTGREREFNVLRKYVSKWKGDFKFEELPIELRSRYQNGNDVFQQLINDLVWFQHSPVKLQAIYGNDEKRKLTQDDRKRQYSMLKLPGLAITDLCFFGDRVGAPRTIPNQNAIKVMEFYAQWPDSWIDITIDIRGPHAVSAYITKEGKFKYFDSNNNSLKVKELSASECVAAMVAEYAPYNIEPKIQDINLHKFHGPAVKDVLKNHRSFDSYDHEMAKMLLKSAFQLGQIEFAELLLRDYITIERSADFINQNCILTDINPQTDRKMIDLFVRYGADINQSVSDRGWTPLHIACSCGNSAVIKSLRRHHANLEATDNFGSTPLLYAVKLSSENAVKYLIDHGANMNAVDNQHFSVLHHAVLGKKVKVLREILKQNRIDVNTPDKMGNTALHYAGKMRALNQSEILNQVQIIKLLREYGADHNAVNQNNDKPIDNASNPGAVAALRERLLLRRDAGENLNVHRSPKSKPNDDRSKLPVASTSSTSSPLAESRNERKSAVLLGRSSSKLHISQDDNVAKNIANPAASKSSIRTKIDFFEEKIREQTKENPRIPSHPKRPKR